MTSMARRTLRATAAVTGIAALGAGLAGTAFAEPHHQTGGGFQGSSVDTASIDGFDTDSIVPADALMNDFAGSLANVNGNHAAPTAGPADGLAGIGNLQGFHFELPPTSFGTAGEDEMAQMGMEPMMTPFMEHALPAILGGQRVSTADPQQGETFGQDNGLPEPVNGPGNEAASPVTGSVMPAVAMVMGTLSDSTTNDDTTSNHEFSL